MGSVFYITQPEEAESPIAVEDPIITQGIIPEDGIAPDDVDYTSSFGNAIKQPILDNWYKESSVKNDRWEGVTNKGYRFHINTTETNTPAFDSDLNGVPDYYGVVDSDIYTEVVNGTYGYRFKVTRSEPIEDFKFTVKFIHEMKRIVGTDDYEVEKYSWVEVRNYQYDFPGVWTAEDVVVTWGYYYKGSVWDYDIGVISDLDDNTTIEIEMNSHGFFINGVKYRDVDVSRDVRFAPAETLGTSIEFGINRPFPAGYSDFYVEQFWLLTVVVPEQAQMSSLWFVGFGILVVVIIVVLKPGDVPRCPSNMYWNKIDQRCEGNE